MTVPHCGREQSANIFHEKELWSERRDVSTELPKQHPASIADRAAAPSRAETLAWGTAYQCVEVAWCESKLCHQFLWILLGNVSSHDPGRRHAESTSDAVCFQRVTKWAL
jgi:hypothetical protein